MPKGRRPMIPRWIFAFTLALVGGVAIAQTQHINGLGQNYSSPVPLGVPGNQTTYSLAMAQAAASAWPESGTIGSATCGGPTAPKVVMKQTPTSCAAWVYSGNLAGRVKLTAGRNCLCPSISD